MKTEDFLQIKHFQSHKGTMLVPSTDESREWLEMLKHNTPVNFKVIEARDTKFHRCYFGLLAYIYDRLPPSFKAKIQKDNFYNFLKILGRQYDVVYSFADGREFITYHSISFGRMNQSKFRDFVNAQLETIYSDLLVPLEMDYLMDDINKEFQNFIDRLL